MTKIENTPLSNRHGMPVELERFLIGSAVKMIRVFQGDLTQTNESYDTVVCSAYKGEYLPLPSTLIGALLEKRKISVAKLSLSPEIDFRKVGCWLSTTIDNPFHRVACLELLDYKAVLHPELVDEIMLKSSFVTLRFLIEQAAIRGIPIHRIALPLLGAGDQGINIEYIAAPLYSQCLMMFSTIDSLECIDFYELNEGRAHYLLDVIEKMHLASNPSFIHPKVFVSYSSKQQASAHTISNILNHAGYSTWIAPESIPAGKNYLEEIPIAINNVTSLLLLLTEDAQNSRWVSKEVASAIGANKIIVPIQLQPFQLNKQFQFLLEGEQIFPAWAYNGEELGTKILEEIQLRG